MTDVQRISVTVPISEQMADDIASMQCLMWLGFALDMEPLTEVERETGWRTRAHGDHEHTYAVAWRAEQMRAAAEAEREAEMAACPYVACQCGHHDDR